MIDEKITKGLTTRSGQDTENLKYEKPNHLCLIKNTWAREDPGNRLSMKGSGDRVHRHKSKRVVNI